MIKLTNKERLQLVRDHFDKMSDEEFEKECGCLFIEEGSTENTWHPSNQNSFYLCWYCGKDGNAHLCTDGMGRGFCPECRERAEKEFLDWDNPKPRESWQDE